MEWENGKVRPVALAELGQQYRRYRLADPHGEEAMAGSLRRWGQLAPVAACVREQKLELLDGFKRWSAARQVRGLTTLSVRVLEVDEPTAKAAILGLNQDQGVTRELEEAWVVQGLVRDDGMTQVEAAQLLGRHKSWVCRRLALVGEVERRGEGGFAFGLAGPGLGAAVDAVARVQPRSGVGLDAAGDTDGAGSERRDRSAARGQRRAGGVRAGRAARGLGPGHAACRPACATRV